MSALNLGDEVALGDIPLDPDTIGSLQREFVVLAPSSRNSAATPSAPPKSANAPPNSTPNSMPGANAHSAPSPMAPSTPATKKSATAAKSSTAPSSSPSASTPKANAWSNATTVNDPNNTTSVFTVRDSVPIINADKCFLRLGSPSCFLRVSLGDHEESLRTLQADAETLAGPADGFL